MARKFMLAITAFLVAFCLGMRLIATKGAALFINEILADPKVQEYSAP